jgi:hypothetical protein
LIRARSRLATWALVAGSALVCAVGCGGAMPLLHPAKPLAEGELRAGVGLATQLAAGGGGDTADRAARAVETLALAPGVSPWVGARIGLGGDAEAGITYAGRAVRIDGRYVLGSRALRLSFGAGATALIPHDDALRGSLTGGGLDVPVLVGWSSASDLYSVWIGPRVGFEVGRGQVPASAIDPALSEADPLPFDAHALQAGGVIGLRVGFRAIHVAAEVGLAWRRLEGAFEGRPELDRTLDVLGVTPGTALQLSF